MAYPKTFAQAEAFETKVKALVATNQANSKIERSAKTLATLKKIQKTIPKGWYRHFKGGFYLVNGIIEDVDTGVCYVKYVADYGLYRGVEGERVLVGGRQKGKNSFVRPVKNRRLKDGTLYTGVRFTYVGPKRPLMKK